MFTYNSAMDKVIDNEQRKKISKDEANKIAANMISSTDKIEAPSQPAQASHAAQFPASQMQQAQPMQQQAQSYQQLKEKMAGQSPSMVPSAYSRSDMVGSAGSFGNDELKPVSGKIDLSSQGVANNQTQPTALSGKINLTTAFVNGYYDIATGSKFRPYLGAGIGLGFISDQDNGLSGFDYGTSFAYQGKVGVQYEVVKKGNAFVEFRYVGLTGYTSKKNNTEIEIGSINSPAVSVGYRQGF
jgi:opacity protein-like surface antigen